MEQAILGSPTILADGSPREVVAAQDGKKAAAEPA